MVNTNCQQCSATTKASNDCRRRTCRGNICWTHLKMKKNLRVKDAPGMGLGLFTTRARYPGDLADVKYTRTHLTWAQYHTLYPKTGPKPEYVICNNAESNCIDGKAVTSYFARFIKIMTWTMRMLRSSDLDKDHRHISLWRLSGISRREDRCSQTMGPSLGLFRIFLNDSIYLW